MFKCVICVTYEMCYGMKCVICIFFFGYIVCLIYGYIMD